ncbi:replication regulatory protein RepA [Salmonella enterica]|nr:replication regulatory protein RepA [Salmonella enterica]
MSQVGNAVTSSSKRVYRKGNPLSAVERQQSHLARKKETHKELRVYVENELKEQLQLMCEVYGVTQSAMIEILIKDALGKQKHKVTD